MFKWAIDKVVKAAPGIARDEVTSLVKGLIFRYVIVMNLVFGVIGFVLGCIVGSIAF